MKYKIFPSIGIARLGQDDNFFLAPELPGSGPVELRPDGTTVSVTKFKDASMKKIRKQGVRFYLFESNDGLTWTEANLPAGATVTWTVTLENKKAAVSRPSKPPVSPMRPQITPGSESMVIKGGTRSITGANASTDPFVGTYKTGNYQVQVELGKLRTDNHGRLIVLGGNGFSSAPPNTPLGGSYYRNPNWHDDVCDGPITAEIIVSPGSQPIAAEGGAWVVVAPPDYAPEINCPVTLYDILKQVGAPQSNAIPSFDLDIAPLIQRVKRLKWVHADATWSDARFDSSNLRDKTAAFQTLREGVRDLILKTQEIFTGHTESNGPPYQLRQHQLQMLTQWVAGNFDNTPAGAATLSASGLTKASLDGAAGQGFCPGIEAGIIVLDSQIYAAPFDFRISHTVLTPGDLTALMAQPWQADFLKCNTEWWPTQRPDIAPQSNGDSEDWVRGAAGHKLLVQQSPRLGIVAKQGAKELFLEVERDPSL